LRMLTKDVKRWLSLCELAAKEQDPKKQRVILQDIARILKAKPDLPKRAPSTKK